MHVLYKNDIATSNRYLGLRYYKISVSNLDSSIPKSLPSVQNYGPNDVLINLVTLFKDLDQEKQHLISNHLKYFLKLLFHEGYLSSRRHYFGISNDSLKSIMEIFTQKNIGVVEKSCSSYFKVSLAHLDRFCQTQLEQRSALTLVNSNLRLEQDGAELEMIRMIENYMLENNKMAGSLNNLSPICNFFGFNENRFNFSETQFAQRKSQDTTKPSVRKEIRQGLFCENGKFHGITRHWKPMLCYFRNSIFTSVSRIWFF